MYVVIRTLNLMLDLIANIFSCPFLAPFSLYLTSDLKKGWFCSGENFSEITFLLIK